MTPNLDFSIGQISIGDFSNFNGFRYRYRLDLRYRSTETNDIKRIALLGSGTTLIEREDPYVPTPAAAAGSRSDLVFGFQQCFFNSMVVVFVLFRIAQ